MSERGDMASLSPAKKHGNSLVDDGQQPHPSRLPQPTCEDNVIELSDLFKECLDILLTCGLRKVTHMPGDSRLRERRPEILNSRVHAGLIG